MGQKESRPGGAGGSIVTVSAGRGGTGAQGGGGNEVLAELEGLKQTVPLVRIEAQNDWDELQEQVGILAQHRASLGSGGAGGVGDMLGAYRRYHAAAFRGAAERQAEVHRGIDRAGALAAEALGAVAHSGRAVEETAAALAALPATCEELRRTQEGLAAAEAELARLTLQVEKLYTGGGGSGGSGGSGGGGS